MKSLYDLHCPASDIAPQARELYRSNLVRYIADASNRPVPSQCLSYTAGAQPVALSHSLLRSVSPLHMARGACTAHAGRTRGLARLRDPAREPRAAGLPGD